MLQFERAVEIARPDIERPVLVKDPHRIIHDLAVDHIDAHPVDFERGERVEAERLDAPFAARRQRPCGGCRPRSARQLPPRPRPSPERRWRAARSRRRSQCRNRARRRGLRRFPPDRARPRAVLSAAARDEGENICSSCQTAPEAVAWLRTCSRLAWKIAAPLASSTAAPLSRSHQPPLASSRHTARSARTLPSAPVSIRTGVSSRVSSSDCAHLPNTGVAAARMAFSVGTVIAEAAAATVSCNSKSFDCPTLSDVIEPKPLASGAALAPFSQAATPFSPRKIVSVELVSNPAS